ncbi:putative disease resistance RPP13-like protein 1 [Morella rubra]|uniref:Putative disease resistance RPP13-like protein 1 n=1 Tax=Morella rubra TaxID=262757 RepID=A0A6A1UHE9_9ROSI|nr:putative disease resistance RPP13-like protein 1 [Morella rubra]
MGGVGKTTFAQLVYSDSRVRQHFNLEVWFCISEEFVVSKVQKSIIEAVTSSPCNTEDPTQVEGRLKENLKGKKFLIVLDDVWTEDPAHQESLSKLLQYGVQGSKILIPTRNNTVGRAMHAIATHRAEQLSDDDCCNVLLPKDSNLEKDRIVLLWMGEGFLQPSKFETMEEVGHRYFLDLVARSLLQQSSYNKALFGMHDLIHDLAKSVAGQFSFTLEQGDTTNEIVKMTRHFSCSCASLCTFRNFEEALSKVKQLRTFLALDSSPWYSEILRKNIKQNVLPMQRCLRVLSIPYNQDITYLPNSIGKLKHIRYLDLSFTRIKRLPNSTCKLINLQTLKLSGCYALVALPKHMWKLASLRHLDIAGTGIKKMPEQLGSLKCLNTLTKFVAGKGNGSSIWELGKLKNLRGTLHISKLQNVVPPKDALNEGLMDKDLEKLALDWDGTTSRPESERIVLKSLRPQTSLKSLTIESYGGGIFLDWVGHHSFSNIASMHLDECRNVCSLPPFGQLCSLKELSIAGLNGVVTVGREFCGNSSIGSSLIQPFGGLKVLRFQQMSGWEEWLSCRSAKNEGGAFPDLKELYIKDFRRLTGGLPIYIPSLAKLEIDSCPKLVASLLRSQLGAVSEYAKIVLEELPTGRRKLEVQRVNEVASLEGIMDSNSPLQELQIVMRFTHVPSLGWSTFGTKIHMHR